MFSGAGGGVREEFEVGIDFRNSLNPEQYAAATAPDGPALVLAAAGTGKTRTLVHRVAFLVERGVSADRILLLTFTNRAAKEMLERARALAGDGAGGIWGGTFHHMANRLLRRHAPLVGYKSDFTILDRDDAESLIAECVKQRNLNRKEFPKKDVLMGIFSAAANRDKPIGPSLEARFDGTEVDPDDVLLVLRDYQSRKKQLDAMDFDDLLLQCRELLRSHGDVCGRYQDKFLHVLVDEYQDTNPIQAQIVDRIVEHRRNLMVVGDDFQSIYGWRGADFRNILSFPDRYSGLAVYKLETNYRSVPEILEVANAVIAGNPSQFQKKLRPVRGGYRKPKLYRVRDGGEQARAAVEQIAAMRRSGYKPSDMAVLYRAHYHAMELQLELAKERIPFVITSGVRFFEQAHIKDACSLLRLLANPEDELAFCRLFGMLPGVGPKTAQSLWGKLGGRYLPGAESDATLEKAMRPASFAAWKKISGVCDAYVREGLEEDPGEAVHQFVEEFYADHAANVFEDHDRRLEEIAEMEIYTSRYENVREFLSDVALLTNLDAESGDNAKPGETVRLSTVHQAKGLEWPVVILLWVSDGMFPSARSVNESPDGMSEERRLFYVAVTRAKDELHICSPEMRRMRDGGIIPCGPSPFITELPPGLLQEVRRTFF